MNPIDIIREKAAGNPGRIILPEGTEDRIIRAAALASAEGLARPVLIGKKDDIAFTASETGAGMKNIESIDHLASRKLSEYAREYHGIQRAAGRDISAEEAESLLSDPLYFGAMAVRTGEADGMVAGAVSYSSSVMRAAYRAVGLKKNTRLFSSFLIISGYRSNHGENGSLVLADPSVNPEPTAEQLAGIAAATARSARTLLGWEPRVAVLSFSTKGSSSSSTVAKTREAAFLARAKDPSLRIEGELQADAALVPEIARVKKADGPVAGKANILIFPNLDAGNISYKLIQHLSGAQCYGPILQGFARPVNDLSRGASVEDIKGVIAITSAQAMEADSD